MRQLLAAACLCWAGFAASAAASTEGQRIVSLDGTTTEIIFALGAGDRVVARDDGSTWPEAAEALPVIGDGHQINVEAILRLRPTLVVGRERPMSGPAMHLLEAARTRLEKLDGSPGVVAAQARIRRVGELLDLSEAAEALVEAMDRDLARLAERQAARSGQTPPKAIVLYLRPGVAMLMGEDSNAAAMLELVGVRSAVPGLKGYKEMNAEAVVAARPDVVVCYADGLASVGGPEGLWRRPGLAQTPAGQARRLVAMDDLLLGGFGPRTGEAALQLDEAIWGGDALARNESGE